MQELTKRQQRVLDFIKEFSEGHGYPPTIREIGDELGIGSTNGVVDHLAALERKGYIQRQFLKSRGIRLLPVKPPVRWERCSEPSEYCI